MKYKYIIIKYINFIIKHTTNICNKIFWKLFNNNDKLKADYVDWLVDTNMNNTTFVPISEENIEPNKVTTKLIAFYLPQFYENESNNKYFGKGFMEWYNTSKTIPMFTGHYQPQLPIDVGFYDLVHDDVMYRQIELAKKYGIYGFCFYYYWFSGDRLLEKPLDNFLNNKNLDMPFCLFWANETWTKLWGSGEDKVIIKKQELKDNDSYKFAQDFIKYIKDSRYIKINNKPLLIIYQSRLFDKEKFNLFLSQLRKLIKDEGFDDLYIVTTDSRMADNINISGLDLQGVVEFWHMNVNYMHPRNLVNLAGKWVNPKFRGRVVDIKCALDKGYHLKENACKTFRCVCAGWDNSPRRAYRGAEIFYMTPKDYKKWIKDSIVWTQQNLSKDEQMVFVDSWNEWAEGAHLEPDQRYGYAYLQATKEALEESVNAT